MVYAAGPRELQTHGIEAASFEALAEIAVKNLREQGPSGVVCGPISTGGTNNQIHNFEVFNAAIRGLQRAGENIFSQVPYEFGLRRLAYAWEAKGNSGYCMPILTVFYTRLVESGLITKGWFIPGWHSSLGAYFEREKLVRFKLGISDLTREEIGRFMKEEHPLEYAEKVLALIPE
ncbi:MAG TPA: hypothetical protein VNF51_00545 [Candidatus Paceibacterota bacterium]|nr:hypothetical protein [Candidatus Paceibacterota bacterium]